MPIDPLKELFRLRQQDLLGLTGDAGGNLVSTDVVELESLTRTVETGMAGAQPATLHCQGPDGGDPEGEGHGVESVGGGGQGRARERPPGGPTGKAGSQGPGRSASSWRNSITPGSPTASYP
jgi:hypothetical protein